MRTQRKTHHLLANNGETGRDFRYIPQINDKHSFNWNETIFVTDKIDGTTVQADSLGVYQRRDLFKKGDPRKFTATEEERYTLVELNLDAPENKHIAKAVSKHLMKFKEIPSGFVIYFECFGNKIQARYKGLTPDIRVFGLTINDDFQWFENTALFCKGLGLQIVGSYFTHLSGVLDVISRLELATHSEETLNSYELEGFVLRQRDEIAKIRKSDLRKILVRDDDNV